MLINRFERNIENYNNNAFIQKSITKNLINLLQKNYNKNFNNIFEIGCGTGFLTNEIYKNIKYKKLFLNDLYDIKLKCDKFYLGNIENIDLPDKLDLVLSSSVLQWIKNIDNLLFKINKNLINNGLFVGSMFINKNFHEIKDIFNIGLDYFNNENLKLLFEKYFDIIYYEEVVKEIKFDNFTDILKHIKNTGVNSIQNFTLTKTMLKNYSNIYNEKYKNILTYNYNFFILKKAF